MAPRKSKKASDDSSSDSGPDDKEPVKPAAKRAKTSTANDDDEPTWELDKRRMLKVREFKGKVMVDIREFYESGGELKPSKKGIALSVSQWKKLVEIVDEVNDAIKEK